MTSKKYFLSSCLATLTFLCLFFVGCLLVQNARALYEDQPPKPILLSEGKTLAEVTLDKNGNMVHCKLHELEEDKDAEPLIRGSGLQVKYPGFKEMRHLINNCTQLEKPPTNTTGNSNTSNSTSNFAGTFSFLHGIAPGTKWCGVGDDAETFEELGPETEVDACCRAHDLCPVKLKAFRSGYGLFNPSLYTRSHCDCDTDFYNCLKKAGNKLSNEIGSFYFNILAPKCIKEKGPLVCLQNRTEIDGSRQCVKYGPDPKSKEMTSAGNELEFR